MVSRKKEFKWILVFVIICSGCVFKSEKTEFDISTDLCNCLSSFEKVSNDSIKYCFNLYKEELLNESKNQKIEFDEFRTSIFSELNETCPELNLFLQTRSNDLFMSDLDTVFHLKSGTYVFNNDTSKSFCMVLNDSTYKVLENCKREVGSYIYQKLSSETFILEKQWVSPDYKNDKKIDFVKICEVNSQFQYLIKEYSNNHKDSLTYILTKIE